MSENRSDDMKRSLKVLLLNQVWFASEFELRGHEVVTAGWTSDDFDIRLTSPLQSAQKICSHVGKERPIDRIVYFDNSAPLGLSGLEDVQIPTLFYAVDSHLHAIWQSWYGACFDKVLVARREYLEVYRQRNSTAEFIVCTAEDKSKEVGKDLSPASHLIDVLEDLSLTERANKTVGAAVAHFFSMLFCMKAKPGVRILAFRELHRRLELVASEDPDLEEVIIDILVMFKAFLDRFELYTDSLTLFENYAEHGLKTPLIAAALIDARVRAEKHEEAKDYARRAFPGKKSAVSEVAGILERAAKELFHKIGVKGVDPA